MSTDKKTETGDLTALQRGVGVIEQNLRNLPASPGVYRMISAKGEALYVGKAKNLKKRVTAYTKPDRIGLRIKRMVARTEAMEFVTTDTEAEALLLEANLIKTLKPRYNILLRDDKSFPSIMVTGDHAFPRIVKHRGARNRKGEYFGPFASAGAVAQTLAVLQRAFLLRTCSDAVFGGRTRPCLLYQIKRCAAPCVGKIDETEYRLLVEQGRDFLRGKSQDIQRKLSRRMQQASDAQRFEEAAQYRDRIQALARVQARQDINLSGIGDADVIAAHQAGGQTCIQVFFYRGGQNFGNRAYYPGHAGDSDPADVIEAFLGQFYANKTIPRQIMVSHRLDNRVVIDEALTVLAGYRVRVTVPKRGAKRQLIDLARNNAREALARRLSESASQRRLLAGLADVLGLAAPLERIEVYDNSHISGSHPVGGVIVAGPEGLIKNAYRKFAIKGKIAPGDDYAMMREVLFRRFSRAIKDDPDRTQWPDLVLIDGGKGQLGVVLEVFAELAIDDVAVAAISKGRDRNAGRERIHRPGHDPISLKARDPVLYFLQRLRDEAHRFAIGTHRAKRSKAVAHSTLDDISGIGPRRKKALLHHFGSARAVSAAHRADLALVDGISRSMADKIYDWFHTGG